MAMIVKDFWFAPLCAGLFWLWLHLDPRIVDLGESSGERRSLCENAAGGVSLPYARHEPIHPSGEDYTLSLAVSGAGGSVCLAI